MDDLDKRKILGIRIKEQRKLRSMSQTDLGDKVGVKFTTIAKYESGEIKSIDSIMLNKISNTLDCSIDYLLGRTDKPKKDILDQPIQIAASMKDKTADLSNLSEHDKNVVRQIIESLNKK